VGGRLGSVAVGVALAGLLGVTGTAAASPPGLDWVSRFGRRVDQESVTAVSTARRSIVVAGTTSGTLSGQVSAGATDGFLRSHATDGTVRWTRQFGSRGDDRVTGVAVGGKGEISVVGSFGGRLPGQPRLGDDDAFLQRWTRDGTLAWTRRFGTSSADVATGVTVDPTGAVTVVGITSGAFRGLINAGDWDVFVRRYSAAGTVVWTRQFGTSGWDQLVGVTSDAAGGVVVAGHTDGVLPGRHGFGGSDLFLRAYDATGRIRWTRQLGTLENDVASGISRGPEGDVYVVGRTGGVFRTQRSAGGDDAMLIRVAGDGAIRWIRQFGTTESDEAEAVALAPDGAAIVAGTTSGDLGGGSLGLADAFLQAVAADGTASWTIQTGTAGMDNAHGVAVDSAGGIDLGGMQRQTAPGNGDAYLRRYHD
jgi:hypothetical protein